LPQLAASTVLLMNGDSFCEVDLAAFTDCHRRHAADLSLVLTRVADPSRYGQVQVTGDGRVVRFGEKRPATGPGWINAGVYLLERRLIEAIPPGRPVSLEHEMIPAWLDRGLAVYGYPCTGRFLDIGTPSAYAAAEKFFAPHPTGRSRIRAAIASRTC
jgi:NDP-sugar pyrophosphorylase family protein